MTIPDSPTMQAEQWLMALDSSLTDRQVGSALSLFGDECYWRDLVSFSWNIKTFEGREAIGAMLEATLSGTSPSGWHIDGEAERDADTVSAWFTFETAVGRGRGHLRLKNGKCWTLMTALRELKGFEERIGERREAGLEHKARKGRKNWLEQRQTHEKRLGHEEQPYCVIIGGGQGGIALAARLRRLDVPTIVLEANARAGDSWRNRYKSLVLHDPVWYDHLPYLPFPDDWPVFTPKDKFGDWLEMYAKVMELDYWSSSPCTGASYDGKTGKWTVKVEREGAPVTLTPKQLVFATGAYGPPLEISIPGHEKFAGQQIHSSQYRSGENHSGGKAIVIGAGSSAHDICVDLWEHDADVTMIQRSATTVVRSETLMELGFAETYSEQAVQAGITTDIADLMVASLPFRLMPQFQIPLYREIAERDAEFYQRLEKAGFRIDFGEDDSGLMMKAMRRAAGYYIDVGASELIANGDIAVRSGVEVGEIRKKSVILTDGTELDADLIVNAIGFGSMNGWVARLVSQEMADTVGPCWGIGSATTGDPGPWEGELRNMWKPTRQPALWFHGGNLALSRHYSLYLSLQIKARMEGMETPVYGLGETGTN